MQLCDAVSTTDGQTLTDVEFGEIHLGSDVINDRSGDINARGRLDSFQARRRIDFDNLRPRVRFQHVYAGNSQTHDLRRADCGLAKRFVEFHGLGGPAAMHIAAKLGPLGCTAHGCNNSISHNKRANVAAFALRHEFLHQHVLPRTLQRLNNCLSNLHRVG